MFANKFVVCMGYALVVYLFILVLLYSTLYILVIFFFVFHTQNNLRYIQFLPHEEGSSPTQLFLSPEKLSHSLCLTYSYLHFTNQQPRFSGKRLTPDPAVVLSYLQCHGALPDLYVFRCHVRGSSLFQVGWDQIWRVSHIAPSCTVHCKPIH